VLRGLTIMLMLLNLSPGSWEHNFAFLVHARWEGWTLIDMVAPAFLFCIGAAMPLSLERRSAKGDARATLLRHVLTRGLLLVAIGVFLNLYPRFDFATFRIPGVLQRIGLCYMLTGVFMLLTARVDGAQLRFRFKPLTIAAVVVLVSYWMLLYFVPVPGFAAQRFDEVGSWPSVVDRAVIGVEHFFPYWPVDGKVVFDPEGILSTWPSCFNVLLGTLAGLAYMRGVFKQPVASLIAAGVAMMVLAMLLTGVCPLIKNIWTSTFALFSGGFCVALLGLLMPVTQVEGVRQGLWPARIFGGNPLLAYIIVFLIAPLIDYNWFGDESLSLRGSGQAWFEYFVGSKTASLLFGVCGLTAIFAVLVVCHRKRWILKL
jgi:predicted acyltransferase